MKSILIVIVAFLSFSAFAQETNQLDDKGQRHGLWKGVHKESKRPRYEGTFEHGKETGVFKYFDDTKTGKVIATRDFSANDGSAYTIIFNQKGNKVSEGKEVNKLNEGEWKFYHLNSNQVMIIENYSKGKLNGIRKVFYNNGAIAEETGYLNGIKNGVYKKYTDTGIVLEDANYKNGQFDGPVTYKNGKGETIITGKFKEGRKSGIWRYYENGKLFKEVNPVTSKPQTFKIVTDGDGKKKPVDNKPKE